MCTKPKLYQITSGSSFESFCLRSCYRNEKWLHYSRQLKATDTPSLVCKLNLIHRIAHNLIHRKAVCSEPGCQWKLEVAGFMKKDWSKGHHANFVSNSNGTILICAFNNCRCSARIYFQKRNCTEQVTKIGKHFFLSFRKSCKCNLYEAYS